MNYYGSEFTLPGVVNLEDREIRMGSVGQRRHQEEVRLQMYFERWEQFGYLGVKHLMGGKM